MSDTNKHFKLNLDRKPNLYLKFEPNFLTWLPKGKIEEEIEDHSVSAIFLIYPIFSNRSQMSFFSSKVYDKCMITMTVKKWGACARWRAIVFFSTDRAQYQGKSAMFSICACTRVR